MTGLPKGWREQRLEELCDFNPKHPRDLSRSTSVSFVPMPAVDEVEGRIRSPEIRPLSEVWKGFTHFQNDDVLFAKITPCMENGKAAVAQGLVNGVGCGSTEFHVLRSKGEIDPKYLWRFLRRKSFRQDAEHAMTGAVGQRRVPKQFLEKTTIPLPSPDEQRRIVVKLDSLTGKTTRAREELERIPALIQKYRNVILERAFNGDLTRDWRSRHGIAEPWVKSTIKDVARIASGQTPKGIEQRVIQDGEVPWFKVSSMNEPHNLEGLRQSRFCLSSDDAAELGLRIFPVGSVAFPKRGGAIATNKKRKLLVPGGLDLNLMVLTATKISHEFLWWWLQRLDLAQLSNGSNVPQINNGDVEPLTIDVPSPDEQKEIVRRLEATFAWLDHIAVEQANAARLLPKLDQAILAKAFCGELVSHSTISRLVPETPSRCATRLEEADGA